VLLLWRPVEGVVSLTLLLIAFLIAEGVFQMATAFALSPHLPGMLGVDVVERSRRSGAGAAPDFGNGRARQKGVGR
jgi:hypothetical protein